MGDAIELGDEEVDVELSLSSEAFGDETSSGTTDALRFFINELSTLNDLRGMTIGVIIIFILPGFFLLHESKCSIVGMIYVLVGILSFLVSAYSFVGTKFYDLTPMEIPKYIPTSGNITR